MMSFRTISRISAVAFAVSATACGDTITQGPAQRTEVPAALVSDTTPLPSLTVNSYIANTSGFTGTGRPGEFLRVEVNGSGFPPGVYHVERTAFVYRTGGVVMPSSGGGEFVATGTLYAAYGQSCPTPYAETFAVVTYGARTIYSKHVPTAC